MNEEVRAIFSSFDIREIGFCAFDTVREHLLDCRAKSRIPQGAKSIILCLFPYKVKEQAPRHISRYAAVPDYHSVCGPMLERAVARLKERFPENRFAWFLDNSPIPEVYAAACAGLGVRGENGLLIHPRYGSWCFIGEVVTDLSLFCQNALRDCMGCGRCREVCPKNSYGTRCLSAVTQQKAPLSKEEEEALFREKLVWGCDLCAEVCPLNKGAQITWIREFINGHRDSFVPGEEIAGRAYAWRGENVVLRNARNLLEKEVQKPSKSIEKGSE